MYGQAVAQRMACSTKPGSGHRKLHKLPAGAKLVWSPFATWIFVGDADVRCSVDGCTRGMRLVTIVDGHKGIKPRTECGARCVNAIGPSCDCKCSGDNHGAN
jgi:hypothetical protein